jgi:hypothetical protein
VSLTTAFLIFTTVACFVSMVLAILEGMNLEERLEDTARVLRAQKKKYSHDILEVHPWVNNGKSAKGGGAIARNR